MALSNIFREPRREIIESVVGLMVFAVFAWGDYHFAQWFKDVTGGPRIGCPWPIGMFFGFLLLVAIIGLVLLTHMLGDAICNLFQERGVHLRPRKRK